MFKLTASAICFILSATLAYCDDPTPFEHEAAPSRVERTPDFSTDKLPESGTAIPTGGFGRTLGATLDDKLPVGTIVYYGQRTGRISKRTYSKDETLDALRNLSELRELLAPVNNLP